MGMFDSLKKALKGFAKGAEEAAAEEPAAPAKAPAAKPAAAAKPSAPPAKAPAAPAKPAPAKGTSATPHVEVVQHDPASKAKAAEEFDDEIEEALEAPGAPPEHALQGAEFEEGDRTTIPTPNLPPPPQPAPAPASRATPAPAPAPAPASRAAPAPAPAPAPVAKAPAKGGKGIDPSKVQDLLWDLELALLESDVAMSVVEEIKERLEERLPEIRVARTEDIPPAVEAALRDALRAVLGNKIDFDEWVLDKLAGKKPVVLMFVGVNGTGKTTTIGRVAYRLREDGFSSVMAAGDTFRAGAIEQLSKHGENLGITVIKTQAGGDPAAVAYDAIEAAKARKKDVVLLDTAGRMQTNTNLMDEMKKIKRVAQPDMIVFVGDSLAGNDAVEQARKFDEAVGIDAAILTKVDTDAKGGAALSIAHAVGKPLLFIGVGQEYGDLIPYDPDWMVKRIFD